MSAGLRSCLTGQPSHEALYQDDSKCCKEEIEILPRRLFLGNLKFEEAKEQGQEPAQSFFGEKAQTVEAWVEVAEELLKVVEEQEVKKVKERARLDAKLATSRERVAVLKAYLMKEKKTIAKHKKPSGSLLRRMQLLPRPSLKMLLLERYLTIRIPRTVPRRLPRG
ncbi:hypothetical protein COCNU_03G003560 [Cocos nucifera]|uniref:Uncharacterized protein n=1 Tax=Cocos nucifera TaxID=13894 RepID=A0A8K0I1P4_COCNU|nr:hypothetical protein COCNU_03G003560 [Cocos nucifera]